EFLLEDLDLVVVDLPVREQRRQGDFLPVCHRQHPLSCEKLTAAGPPADRGRRERDLCARSIARARADCMQKIAGIQKISGEYTRPRARLVPADGWRVRFLTVS